MDITEEKLKLIIREECEKIILSEMSFRRSEYKQKIDDLFEQILQNLILVLLSNMITNITQYKSHWKNELIAHIDKCTRYNMNKNTIAARRSVIAEVVSDNDYLTDRNSFYLMIVPKLRKENIDIETEEVQKAITIGISIIPDIIELIISKDEKYIQKYIKKL